VVKLSSVRGFGQKKILAEAREAKEIVIAKNNVTYIIFLMRCVSKGKKLKKFLMKFASCMNTKDQGEIEDIEKRLKLKKTFNIDEKKMLANYLIEGRQVVEKKYTKFLSIGSKSSDAFKKFVNSPDKYSAKIFVEVVNELIYEKIFKDFTDFKLKFSTQMKKKRHKIVINSPYNLIANQNVGEYIDKLKGNLIEVLIGAKKGARKQRLVTFKKFLIETGSQVKNLVVGEMMRIEEELISQSCKQCRVLEIPDVIKFFFQESSISYKKDLIRRAKLKLIPLSQSIHRGIMTDIPTKKIKKFLFKEKYLDENIQKRVDYDSKNTKDDSDIIYMKKGTDNKEGTLRRWENKLPKKSLRVDKQKDVIIELKFSAFPIVKPKKKTGLTPKQQKRREKARKSLPEKSKCVIELAMQPKVKAWQLDKCQFTCFQIQWGSGSDTTRGKIGGAYGGVLMLCDAKFTVANLKEAMMVSLDTGAYAILTQTNDGYPIVLKNPKNPKWPNPK